MGIDPAAEFAADHADPDAGKMEGGHGQDQKQAFQSGGSIQAAGLDLKAIGFVVEEVFFQIKAQAVLIKGGQVGVVIADQQPGVLVGFVQLG